MFHLVFKQSRRTWHDSFEHWNKTLEKAESKSRSERKFAARDALSFARKICDDCTVQIDAALDEQVIMFQAALVESKLPTIRSSKRCVPMSNEGDIEASALVEQYQQHRQDSMKAEEQEEMHEQKESENANTKFAKVMRSSERSLHKQSCGAQVACKERRERGNN